MSIWKKFERIMMAVTFAEAGEHDTAREILKEKCLRKQERQSRRPRARQEMRAPSARR